jgi:hypothetical protein
VNWQSLLGVCLGLAIVVGGIALRRKASAAASLLNGLAASMFGRSGRQAANTERLIIVAALVIVMVGAIVFVLFARDIPVGA